MFDYLTTKGGKTPQKMIIIIWKQPHIQGESKKSGISKIMGISSSKYIRKGHTGGVLENSGHLLPDGH